MTNPYPRLLRQTEQLLRRSPQIVRAAAREVGPRGANRRMEERVPAEHIGADLVSQMIGRVAGEVDGFDSHRTNVNYFIVFEELIEDGLVLSGRHTVAAAEDCLHLVDAFAYADSWSFAGSAELGLQVGCGAEVIGMGVGFEDVFDFVVVELDEGEQGVGGFGADAGVAGVEV